MYKMSTTRQRPSSMTSSSAAIVKRNSSVLSKPSLTWGAALGCGPALRANKSRLLSHFKTMGAVREQEDHCSRVTKDHLFSNGTHVLCTMGIYTIITDVENRILLNFLARKHSSSIDRD